MYEDIVSDAHYFHGTVKAGLVESQSVGFTDIQQAFKVISFPYFPKR